VARLPRLPITNKFVEFLPKSQVINFKEVKLNADYTAKVYADKVEVGCQTFPSSVLHDLLLALELVKAES